MRGPTVTLIPRVIAAILDDLPRSLLLGRDTEGTRKEVPSIPERVIREAVVNSLMHRSYAVHETVQVIRYSNRIEIINPGHSLKPEDRFDDPGSIHRNPAIAAVLHETLFAETKGSGIGVMRQMMEENGLAPPSFESDRDRDTFTGRFLFHHFLGEQDAQWLAAFSDHGLSPEKMKALIFVREVGAIDNATYRTLAKIDTLNASRDLRDLHELELLEKRGQGPRTHYVAGSKFPPFPITANMEASEVIMDGAIHDKGATVSEIQLDQVPEKLRVRVRTLQLQSRKNPDVVKDIVTDLCGWRNLSSGQIASLLGLTQTYVSQKYIAPLVSEGRIVYTRPEMIQHPDQKYRKA